jgi:16S rRNA (adenine1518-N6/adenine1519-N6)-dimethyltransferase
VSSLSEIRKTLRERSLHLNRQLGQHLLIDANIRRKFVETANLTKRDLVIEIGPGTGLLTETIVEKAGYVVAIEIDRGFAAYLRERFSDTETLSIVHQDVLKCDLSHICYQAVRKSQLMELGGTKIIGSLPFNINSPIIHRIAEDRMPLDLCAFVVQKEAAERYSASPGTKLYSAVSVSLQYRFAMERLFRIDRKCFFPVPDVNAAVIRLTPYEKPPVNVVSEELFFKIVRAGFGQRRKMLKNSLHHVEELKDRRAVIGAAFDELNIPQRTRPEELSIEQFADLANALADSGRSL